MSRKDKKSIKKRQRESEREDFLTNIGDAGDFENLVEMTKKIEGGGGGKHDNNNNFKSKSSSFASGNSNSSSSDRNKFDSVASMKKAVSALMPRKA